MVLGGTGAYAVKVGIGTDSPRSTLHIAAAPDGGYGSYLQIPVVHSAAEGAVRDVSQIERR